LEKEKQLEKTNKLQSKLDKEKDWWDKWINDDDIQSYAHDLRNFLSKKFNKEFFSFDLKFKSEKIVTDWMDIKNGYFAHTSFNCEKKSREVIKLIAEYYKEKI
jgi:hypothetical protein